VEPGDRGSGQPGGEPADDPPETGPTPSQFGALNRRRALLGMGAVAGVAAVDVGGFAYAGSGAPR
jgi:catalase